MYDVIIVGARVAGASTALLLARRGVKVLCVDQAHFPSDTLSTHQIQLPGVARLKRWGLLDSIIAANTPATRELRLDTGNVVLAGRLPAFEGVDAIYGPRRTILDKILVDSARASGAEVREDLIVEELSSANGRVSGVRGRAKSGLLVTETAPLIIGADGKHSVVAKAVSAATYWQKPILSAAYYSYWEGLRTDGGELYELPHRAIGLWPTNDGLTLTYIALPAKESAAFRSDLTKNISQALAAAGDLSERVRAARQVGRFKGSGYLPNWFRKPYGPGWALVGDAGFVLDPLTGQGISHAFRDAELLANAVVDGLGGAAKLERALRRYETERNRQGWPLYKLTARQAVLGPRKREVELLYEAVQGNQAEIDKLLGLIAGAVAASDYMSARHLLPLLGTRLIANILREKLYRRF